MPTRRTGRIVSLPESVIAHGAEGPSSLTAICVAVASGARLLGTRAAGSAATGDRRLGEMAGEPACRVVGHGLKSTGFLEQVCGRRDYCELDLAPHHRSCLAVQREHLVVVASDDQECRRSDMSQFRSSKVRPSTARDNSCRPGLHGRGDPERCRRTGARTEESEGQRFHVRLRANRRGGMAEALCEEGDVEDLPAVDGLLRCQEVEEQRCKTGIAQPRRDVFISGAVSAAPAAVGEDDDAEAVSGTTKSPGSQRSFDSITTSRLRSSRVDASKSARTR